MSEDEASDGPDSAAMERRAELAESVETPRRISPAEAETVIRFARDEETYLIETMERPMVRQLLNHSLASITRVQLQDETERFRSFRGVDSVPPIEGDEFVFGVAARLPVGTLNVKGSSRASHAHSSIINTPKNVEETREAFGDDA